jgi:hypothetical protein
MQTARDRIQDDLNRLAVEEAERPYIRQAGIDALLRLVAVAKRDSGQSITVGRFLLSLYNGEAFPFPVTALRGLDTALWNDCMALLRMDRRPEQEVHEYVVNGDAIWSQLKKDWAQRAN